MNLEFLISSCIYSNFHPKVEWIEAYNLPPLSIVNEQQQQQMLHDDTIESSETNQKLLLEYQLKLQEYGNKFGKNSMNSAGEIPTYDNIHDYFRGMGGSVDDDSSYTLVQDDGYEGDLHYSLGTIYMSMNDLVIASSHFDQAVRLYELAGEHESVAMANTKYNKAILNLYLALYGASADAHNDALDLYQHIYGPDINPFSESSKLKSMLHGFDLSTSASLFNPAGGGSLLDDLFGELFKGTYDQLLQGSSATTTTNNNIEPKETPSIDESSRVPPSVVKNDETMISENVKVATVATTDEMA